MVFVHDLVLFVFLIDFGFCEYTELEMLELLSVMQNKVLTVNKDSSIHDAIKLLVAVDITGLPVVDDDYKLVGIISEKDIIKLVCDPEASEFLHDGEDNGHTVSEFMTSELVTFDVDDDMLSICEFLSHNNIRRVPIVSDGKLAGIVSRRDIIWSIYKLGRSKGGKSVA